MDTEKNYNDDFEKIKQKNKDNEIVEFDTKSCFDDFFNAKEIGTPIPSISELLKDIYNTRKEFKKDKNTNG